MRLHIVVLLYDTLLANGHLTKFTVVVDILPRVLGAGLGYRNAPELLLVGQEHLGRAHGGHSEERLAGNGLHVLVRYGWFLFGEPV